MCLSIVIPHHLSIANHANCHYSSGLDLDSWSEPQNMWGWPAHQKWADIGRAYSPVHLAHGILQALLRPRPNSQHFLTLSLSLHGRQLKLCTSDGTWTQGPGLEHGQDTDWDLNPLSFNWKITHLASGVTEAKVLYVSWQKNSVREKGIGKKWIYLERYTFHRQNVVHIKR